MVDQTGTKSIPNFALSPAKAAVAVIDIQEKLAAAMPTKHLAASVEATLRLLQGAKLIDVPLFATEQYPAGLGSTLPQLAPFVADVTFEKKRFSCMECEPFAARVREGGYEHVILTGMETHVCVYQTTLDLLAAGIQVWIPQECVMSRVKSNWRNGLQMMQQAGAIITNVESVLFQLLAGADAKGFREISKLIK